jgi:hypothetical protein
VRGGRFDNERQNVVSPVVRKDRAQRLPDAASDLVAEFRRQARINGQDGFGAPLRPVISEDRVIVATIVAESQGGSRDEPLRVVVAVVAEQEARLPKDEVEFAGVTVEFQTKHAPWTAWSPAGNVDRPTRDKAGCPKFPSVWCQKAIEARHELDRLLGVWSDEGMSHMGQEVEQHLVGPVGKLEA